MEENKKSGWKRILIFTLMFIMSGGIVSGGCLLHGCERAALLRNVIMTLAGCGIVIFSFLVSEINHMFVYRSDGKYARLAVTFLICLGACVFLPYLPVTGWPFVVIFVLLGMFSNAITGLSAGCVCLLLAVSLAGGDYAIFWLYFVSGMTGILVFSKIDEDFKVGLPILISLLVLMVCLTANVILFDKERLQMMQFLIPAVNLIVSCILLLVVLKIFSSSVIHRYRERYMEINDPECPLLVQLKEMSKEEYYHAIHTAYLSDKIAKRLGLDDGAVKACGYYHRIGLLRGKNTWENVEAICKEYHFPPVTRKYLKEYVDDKERVVSRETLIVLFSDCIVSAILFLFKKDPKAEIDYEQLVNTIFQKKFQTDELLKNNISLAQLCEMKKIFAEEKLYYDFLR